MQRSIESLQDAAKAGDVEAARKLLAGGADVNGKDQKGITPLGVAVGFNKIPVIQLLLESGADVEQTDPKGNTALHYAAGKCSFTNNIARLFVHTSMKSHVISCDMLTEIALMPIWLHLHITASDQ